MTKYLHWDYERRIEEHLDHNNSRQVWVGIQHITNHRTSHAAAEGDISLVEKLKHIFWVGTSSSSCSECSNAIKHLYPQDGGMWGEMPQTVCQPQRGSRTWWCSWMCAEDLCRTAGCTGLAADLGSLWRSQARVPSSLESSYIVPITKKNHPTPVLHTCQPIDSSNLD